MRRSAKRPSQMRGNPSEYSGRQFDGRQTLMLRAANERQNVIMEASAQLRLIRDEQTVEGYRIRRIYDLAPCSAGTGRN
jgi:hypothetical protein